MKQISEPIVFFGNEQLATGTRTDLPLLRGLVADGYNIKYLVISQADFDSSRQKKPEAVLFAEQNKIAVLAPSNIMSIEKSLVESGARIGILAAYGKIIPSSIIDIFPLGIINLHPSLLPLHRGPTPIESVILVGEQKSGVSIMQLGEKMDAGPIFGQSEVGISSDVSKQVLADQLGEIGAKMMLELLPDILNESLQAVAQDDSNATYDKPLSKADGNIDWHKSAAQLEREIRAYSGWPKSYARLGQVDLAITGAHDVPSNGSVKPGTVEIVDDTYLMVYCKDSSLCIDRVHPAGKKEMPIKDFLLGYGSRLI